ncbi:segregation/condensation protein A [Streptomyces sp. HMX87]|uniref:segregation/condensation protein A n=1 Tax=Streptomyces sp. HMX87 TaxID=3390849 RepID=UPI003A873A0C
MGTETGTGAGPSAEPAPQTVPWSRPEPQPATEPHSQRQRQAERQPEGQWQPEPEPEPQAGPAPAPAPEAESAPLVQAESAPVPQARPAPPAQTDSVPPAQAESAPGGAPAAEPGTGAAAGGRNEPVAGPDAGSALGTGPGRRGESQAGPGAGHGLGTGAGRRGESVGPGAGSGLGSGAGQLGESAAVPVAGAGAGGADEQPDGGDGGFKVRLDNFEGPFDLLLQLISKHKLDVTEVALSKVTDEFMAYIRALGPDWDLDETTEFLVVAATLLDLKAARLLPAAEVEDEADLALLEARDLLFARLLQYRAYKRIAEIFSERLDAEARRHPRTVGLEPHHAALLPEVVISIGPEGFAKLAVKAMQPKPRPQVYVEHIHAPLVSVQEQAGIVVARLKELGEASFRALVADTDDTLTVVARFLALLELYREKAVTLDQETALGELLVRWTGGDADAAPMVTDEFDRPPEQPKEEERKP